MAASVYKLRASSADRWVNCTGSVKLNDGRPEDDTPEAIEGTAAHFVATELLQGRVLNIGDATPNGIKVTEEMIEGAALYYAAVMQRIPVANQHVEQSLPAPDIHPDNGGTSDTWGLGFDPWTLHVVDYKFGHGYVEAFENWQCIDYVSMALSFLQSQGSYDPATHEPHLVVEITVVQPRSYHREGPVRSWRVRLSSLRAQFNVLRGAAELATSDNAFCTTGVWCEHCPGRHDCAALLNATGHISDRADTPIPLTLSPTQIGGELRRLDHAFDLMEARRSGLQVQALELIRKGEQVPHYAAEHGVGREVWKPGSDEVVIAIGKLLNVDLAKPAAAVTPTQAKNKGVDEAVISEHSHRPPGKLKLVPMDSTQTRKIFGGNTA